MYHLTMKGSDEVLEMVAPLPWAIHGLKLTPNV